MRGIALALVLIALAGCVAPNVQTASVKAPPLPDLTKLAGTVAIVDAAAGQGEPSLGFAPDGTPWTNVGATVYSSADRGANWTKVGNPTAPFPDEDADLVVDQDGTIWSDTLWIGCSSTASSRDNGTSWTVSHLACVPASGDRQYLIPTKGGTAYIYSHHAPTFYQTVAKTTDYGATWAPAGIAEGALGVAKGESGWGGGGFWNAAHDSIYVTFSWFDSIVEAQAGTNTKAFHPAAAVSRDGGQTWDMEFAPTAGGTSVGLSLVVGAADDAGNSYLAWAEAKGDDTAVYMSVSTDDGKTWGAPVVVADEPGSKVFPAIAAGAPGRVAIAYYHADKNAYPSAAPKDAKWNVSLAWTSDALAPNATWSHGQLSTHSVRTGAICPDGTICKSDRELLDYFALKAAPDGRVGSVWTSTDDVDGKVVNVYGVTASPLLR